MKSGTYIQINKPEYYTNGEFLTWLNSDIRIFTWHFKGNKAYDFSDVILYYEEDCESFAELPLVIAIDLYEICKPYTNCLVWITNLS